MTIVYYFTRTGTCERIAAEVAAQEQAEVRRIGDGRNWKGLFGFIRGGYYASARKGLPAQYDAPGAQDRVVLVAPVWAGGYPPAVRTFIGEVGRDRIELVSVSGGGFIKDRDGFARVTDRAMNAENKQ